MRGVARVACGLPVGTPDTRSPQGRVVARAQKLLDATVALAHLLATRAAQSGRACDAAAASDAAEAARRLWLIAEGYAEEEAAT